MAACRQVAAGATEAGARRRQREPVSGVPDEGRMLRQLDRPKPYLSDLAQGGGEVQVSDEVKHPVDVVRRPRLVPCGPDGVELGEQAFVGRLFVLGLHGGADPRQQLFHPVEEPGVGLLELAVSG